MFSYIGQNLETMAVVRDVSKIIAMSSLVSSTYPLSPVAKIKFFHLGCSQINKLASAVSVHQHMLLLKSSLSLKRGINLAIAFRMVSSEESG
jgi:hypothetical protein